MNATREAYVSLALVFRCSSTCVIVRLRSATHEALPISCRHLPDVLACITRPTMDASAVYGRCLAEAMMVLPSTCNLQLRLPFFRSSLTSSVCSSIAQQTDQAPSGTTSRRSYSPARTFCCNAKMAPFHIPNEILTAIAVELAIEIDGTKLGNREYEANNDVKLATLTALCRTSKKLQRSSYAYPPSNTGLEPT